jgi:L-asparaginase II
MEGPGQTTQTARVHIDVEVWRGSIAESRHRIQAAVVDASGMLRVATEQPERVTTFRSAAKPFQLLPLVEGGLAERWDFSEEQLAVMAASHTGSPHHIALVKQILLKIGLTDANLACGYHDPLDPESLAEIQSHPERRTALYNNCSGKHAGMLAQTLAEGWPLEGYEQADHPLQRRMRETVADVCGMEPQALLVAIDGCSVSVFGVPLTAMARAYARFAAAKPEGGARDRALDRIRTAMIRHPGTTGGGRRFSTRLMEVAGGTLVAKGGAEGLECVGVPSRGLGIVVKCEDGHARGIGPAVVALLEYLDVLTPQQVEDLASWSRPEVRNVRGLKVGEIRARVDAFDRVTS